MDNYGSIKTLLETIEDEYERTALEFPSPDLTKRGFSYLRFTDRYRQKCSLQQSSLATESAIWFGIDVDLNGKEVGSRMHLTETMVRQLLPTLQHWVETGEIKVISAEENRAILVNLHEDKDDE